VLFHTLDFVVFFCVVLSLYHAVPQRFRFYILLAASLCFYGYWNLRVLGLLVLTVALNFVLALRMNDDSQRKRLYLILALLVNLSFLGVFKYYNFFVDSLRASAAWVNISISLDYLEILLPAGISFYTFELISYSVDTYRGRPAERQFSHLLLFGTFFPKMMAGPIARVGDLLPQLIKPAGVDVVKLQSGVLLFLIGLAKKVVVADHLGAAVNRILGNTQAPMNLAEIQNHADPGGPAVLLAGMFFACQIYADFSGYSDMARGMSRMLGIELPVNFSHPFLSANPAEFWRRWHITLGAFLRDYIYIPLGGNRAGLLWQVRNVIIVWLIGGLWHGASVGYLAWGGYCGLSVAAYLLIQRLLPGPAPEWISRPATFCAFALGLLIFRLGSPAELLRALGTMGSLPWAYLWPALFTIPVVAGHIAADKGFDAESFFLKSRFRFALAVNGLFYLIMVPGLFQGEEFFYFQF
jgi:alginate O-acetyltransferase complex protein AlgI